MRHDYHASYKAIELRQIGYEDLESLRTWRNNKENTRFLRDIGYITEDMQARWFQEYLDSEDELVFAIVETSMLKCIVGSVALYNWNRVNRTCEIGKIQIGEPMAHGKGIGRLALVLAMRIAFQQLGVVKICASVNSENVQAYHNDMKVGFSIVGENPSSFGGSEFDLEITEDAVRISNEYYDLISF